MWLVCPTNSESLAATCHDLEEHSERQEQLSEGLVTVSHEQSRQWKTSILSYRQEGTDGSQ